MTQTQDPAGSAKGVDAALASKFARIALGHVTREYPNKLDHVLEGDADAAGPRALHPVFYGSFDWHSCVHGYWLLARVLRRFPDLDEAARIKDLFDAHMTPALVAGEVHYLARPASRGFERPYGWAWLLMLAAELKAHPDGAEGRWFKALEPLAEVFSERFKAFLPKATYPVRTGVHSSTAFALRLALEYGDGSDPELSALVREKALAWYGADADAQAWEPSGDDFLSPTLMEAEAMRRVLPLDSFVAWFDRFLPRLYHNEPPALFKPAAVSDRTDGKIAHLDGLNLSRSWCFAAIGDVLPEGHPSKRTMQWAAGLHLEASLPHVAGDYMGEHWLASFALLALECG